MDTGPILEFWLSVVVCNGGSRPKEYRNIMCSTILFGCPDAGLKPFWYVKVTIERNKTGRF